MHARRALAVIAYLVGSTQGACYFAPPAPSTDFSNSVLVLSSPNLLGGNPVDVSVFLQRTDGTTVEDSIVQVQANDCDVAQPTAPTDPNGQSTGSIVAAPDGLHPVQATVTVTAQQVTLPVSTTVLVLTSDTQDPNAVQAGIPLSMQAIARKRDGRINTQFSGHTHFVSSDPGATLPDDGPMDATFHGVKVWPAGIVLRTKGQQVVQVIDSDTGALLASEQFTVIDGPIGKLTFAQTPVRVTAGQPFTARIQVENPSGGLLPTYTGSVAFTSSDANSTLPPNYTFATKDAGVQTFTFVLTKSGPQSLQITDGTVVSKILVNVLPGAPAGFQLRGVPDPATAGFPYASTLTAVDAYGNIATTFVGSVSVSSNDVGAQLPSLVNFSSADAGSVSLGQAVLAASGNTTVTVAAADSSVQGAVNLTVHKVIALSHQVAEQEGYGVTCAVIDSGQLKCWGFNSSGNLGLGDTQPRGGAPYSIGANLAFVDLGAGQTVKQIDSGTFHTCAVLNSNNIKCWGNNSDGQLGIGDLASRGDFAQTMGDKLPTVDLGSGRTARTVACGARHTCALLDNGTVKCWGRNDVGELGLGDSTSRGGANTMGPNLPAVNLGSQRTARQISSGSYHTCAVLDTNDVKCWGYNSAGALGMGDVSNRAAPASTVINLGSGRTAVQVSTGGYHTCAVLDDQSVKCWGYNNEGELGLGDTTNRLSPTDAAAALGSVRVATVSASLRFNCARLTDGTVKCWGFNSGGELGMGDVTNRGDRPENVGDNLPTVDLGLGRTATRVRSGASHACVVLDVGTVRCWGDNSYGQLGTGYGFQIGQKSNDMGDDMAPVLIW